LDQTGTIPAAVYSDAAKRLSEAINLHIHAQGDAAFFKIVAFRLDTGASDGNLYDNRDDAIRHVRSKPGVWAFATIHPTGTNPREAESALRWARFTFDELGTRIESGSDPEPIAPNQLHDFNRLVASRRRR
jgi:hypothetical protein